MACPFIGLGFLPKNPADGDGFKNGFVDPVAIANRYDFIGAKT